MGVVSVVTTPLYHLENNNSVMNNKLRSIKDDYDWISMEYPSLVKDQRTRIISGIMKMLLELMENGKGEKLIGGYIISFKLDHILPFVFYDYGRSYVKLLSVEWVTTDNGRLDVTFEVDGTERAYAFFLTMFYSQETLTEVTAGHLLRDEATSDLLVEVYRQLYVHHYLPMVEPVTDEA